jgi:MFS family permease
MNNSKNIPKDTIALTAVLMCVLSSAFYFYEYFLRVAPSVIQSELTNLFDLSAYGFGALMAYYYNAYTPLQLPVGVIMDKFGPRRILTLACICCSIGTFIFIKTETLMIAKLGRFLVGIGSAFAYVGVLKIATIWLPKKYFALIAGLCTTIGMAGGICSEKITTYLLKNMHWREAFMLSVYVGIALTLLIWFVVRDKKEKQVIQKKRIFKHTKTITQELAIIVKNKTLWLNGFIGCLTFLQLTGFAEVWAIPYLKSTGLNIDSASTCSSMVFLGFAIGSPIWGHISDKIKSRRIPLIFGSLLATIFFTLCLLINDLSTAMLASLFFIGAFFSSAQVLVFAVANDITEEDMAATSLSFTNFLVMTGGLVLQPLIGKIIDYSHNYQLALCIIPIGTAIAVILSYIMAETYN